MTELTIDPHSATEKARELLEADMNARIDAVRVVAEAAQVATDYERRAAEARTAHEGAWRVALSKGWTERELKTAGVPAPGQPAPRVRRGRRAPSAETTHTDATHTETGGHIDA